MTEAKSVLEKVTDRRSESGAHRGLPGRVDEMQRSPIVVDRLVDVPNEGTALRLVRSGPRGACKLDFANRTQARGARRRWAPAVVGVFVGSVTSKGAARLAFEGE